ncbi:hypothetical protein Gpo141_00006814 [Globisporangium polare]
MAVADTTMRTTSSSSLPSQPLMMHKLPPVHSTMNIRRPNLSAHVLKHTEKLPSSGFVLPMASRTLTEGIHQLRFTSAPLLSPTESSRFGDACREVTSDIEESKALSPISTATATTSPVPRLPSIQSRFAKQTQSAPHQVKDLAGRLALLLHARECCKGDAVCHVPNCSIARGVLDHCQECFLGDGECHASCSQAKNLLRHFRICRAQSFPASCQVCAMLRSEFSWAMQHAESLTPLFLQNQSQQTQSPPASSRSMSMGSLTPSSFGPVSLRRVVSDDPSRRSSPTSLPLPVYPAKRQRFEQ